jgi:hypothetical protein
MCTHAPKCADADSPAATTARVLVEHYEQGWCLLCNGVILFEDGTGLLPGSPAEIRQSHLVDIPAA